MNAVRSPASFRDPSGHIYHHGTRVLRTPSGATATRRTPASEKNTRQSRPSLLRWLTSLAPRGVVEFVPKSNPTIQRMLAAREDIFNEYTEQAFTTILSGLARIARSDALDLPRRPFVRAQEAL